MFFNQGHLEAHVQKGCRYAVLCGVCVCVCEFCKIKWNVPELDTK